MSSFRFSFIFKWHKRHVFFQFLLEEIGIAAIWKMISSRSHVFICSMHPESRSCPFFVVIHAVIQSHIRVSCWMKNIVITFCADALIVSAVASQNFNQHQRCDMKHYHIIIGRIVQSVNETTSIQRERRNIGGETTWWRKALESLKDPIKL